MADDISMSSYGHSQSVLTTDHLDTEETAFTNNSDLQYRMTQDWKGKYNEEKILAMQKELITQDKEEHHQTEQPICQKLNVGSNNNEEEEKKQLLFNNYSSEFVKTNSKMTMICYDTLNSQDSYDFAIEEIQLEELHNMISNQNYEYSKVKIFKIKISDTQTRNIGSDEFSYVSFNTGNPFIFLHSEIIQGLKEEDLKSFVNNMMRAQVFYYMSQENIQLNFQNFQLITNESCQLDQFLFQQPIETLLEITEVDTKFYLQNQESQVLHWRFPYELILKSCNTDVETLKQKKDLDMLTTSLSKILRTNAYVFKTIKQEDQQIGRAHYYDLIYENQINIILKGKCSHINKVSEEIFYIDENSEIRGYFCKSPVLTTIKAQIQQEISNSFDCFDANQPLKYCDILEYYFFDLLMAICCIHKNGFSHGDIKPDNILIDKSSSNVKIADLGTMINFNSPLKKEGCLQKQFKIKGITRHYASEYHRQCFDSGETVTEDDLKAEDRYQLMQTMKELDEYMHKLQDPEQKECNCQIKSMISDIENRIDLWLSEIFQKWRYDANIQCDIYLIYKLLPNFKIDFDFHPYYDQEISNFLQNIMKNRNTNNCCQQDIKPLEIEDNYNADDKYKNKNKMLQMLLNELRDFIQGNYSYFKY